MRMKIKDLGDDEFDDDLGGDDEDLGGDSEDEDLGDDEDGDTEDKFGGTSSFSDI